MTKWGDHLREATKERDGKTPSSSRIYAGWLIMFVILIQMVILCALTWKLLRLDPWAPNAPALAGVYAGVFKVFLMWSMLFDVATALSLYGVNIWGHVASLRTGIPFKESELLDAPMGVPTPGSPRPVVTIPRVAPVVSQVVPPARHEPDHDVPFSRVD